MAKQQKRDRNQQGQQRRGKPTQQKQPKFNLTEIAQSGINEGINAFIEAHPRFSRQENFLASYINPQEVNKYLAQSIETLKDKYGKVDPEKVKDTLAGYVNSGEVFNEKGKEILLSHSWDKKSKRWWASEAREIIQGEKYLDKTMSAFRDLYNLVSSEDYAKHNPKLAKAVAGVYNLGFTDAALNVLYENGQLDKTKYATLKRAIVDRAKQGEEYVTREIETSALPQKIAATALAGVGTAIILGTNSITGNVIGATKTSIIPLLIGASMIMVGIWLGFKKK